MEPHDIRDYLEAEITFPIDQDELVAAIGDTEIDAPDAEESETIARLLANLDNNTYESADALTQMLHSLLPEEYVGRKYYDDRSDEPQNSSVRQDEEDQSF